MRYTDGQLIERVEGLPTFKGWRAGVYDIWVRRKADTPNRFDDKVYTFYVDEDNGNPKFVMKCTGTSNPGVPALKGFRRYNRKGAAVLKSDVIVYESHHRGLHKGKPAYRQSKCGFPYYRDGNYNRKCEEIGPVYNDRIYANCHPAGRWISKFIGWWSAGCLVRNSRRQWNKWMAYMKKMGDPNLTVVILKEF